MHLDLHHYAVLCYTLLMRTTITFHQNTYKKVAEIKAQTGQSISDVVNNLVDIAVLSKTQRSQSKKFKVIPKNLGTFSHLDYSDTGKLLEKAEGPTYK